MESKTQTLLLSTELIRWISQRRVYPINNKISISFLFDFVRLFLALLGSSELVSARLPPMWPGFDSRTRRHMWVEFVVRSSPCSEGFFLRVPRFFLPPQKPTFLNSNSIWNSRATGLLVRWLFSVTLVNQSQFVVVVVLFFVFFLFFFSSLQTVKAPVTQTIFKSLD